MKVILTLTYFALLVNSCRKEPVLWAGPQLTQPRTHLTVEHLLGASSYPFIDMSFFGRPEWAEPATHHFSGAISFEDTELIFPIDRAYYPGENIFPGINLDFISHGEELIPVRSEILVNGLSTNSSWNVIVGTGKIWYEEEDGAWWRASFPLSLTDSYIGQVRNCVATFVYKEDAVSNVCVQCSQETADLNDHQVGNIRVMLPAEYQSRTYADSLSVIEKRNRLKSKRLPVYPLTSIDTDHDIADYFEKSLYTNSPTSLGAVLMDDRLYLQPPQTRHGAYPYPDEMRHGVYSVTKSMTGALALFYFAERYGEEIFDALITDHVAALADHPAWQGVTFSHTLNMLTGTEGGEDAGHLYEILVKARSAEESIQNIAGLGDYPGGPGESFNYASTNLFVLSYAMQNYVEKKEGAGISYWDLVREEVLVPLGAEDFTFLRTVESDGSQGLPILAYGAWPTLDNAAKIALLFSREGSYMGQQLLHREKCREALGRTAWTGISTGNDSRGKRYRHSFWATDVRANRCNVNVSYMLGYGGNYVWFFPSDVVAIRFMDEYDLDFKDLVNGVEKIRSSCH
ncbi:MAG: serine hydrolase [Bacteroidales bacterium]|nr:serine hydrolase [Bacteroidales bacterium]